MADILAEYLCEVDRVEKLEDGTHHRVWVHTLCPKQYIMVFTVGKVGSNFQPGFKFRLDFEDGFKKGE